MDRCLRELGFKRRHAGEWAGDLDLEDGRSQPVLVRLPKGFPDCLPHILCRRPPQDQIAHVAQDRKICIAPDPGAVVDPERPEQVVLESLERARRTLSATGDLAREIKQEFEAYWPDWLRPPHLTSILEPQIGVREIAIAVYGPRASRALAAPSLTAAESWTGATGHQVHEYSDGLLIGLDNLPMPPPFGSPLTLEEVLTLVHDHAAERTADQIWAWILSHGLPATLILCAPGHDGIDHVLFGVRVPEPSGKAVIAASRGYRKGHAPGHRTLHLPRSEPIQRVRVQRADPLFVVPRGGSDVSLQGSHVCIAGCGAVGSHVAQQLAALGVGRLTLVDPEVLEAANIHRHALGAGSIGEKKSEGLARMLRSRFPHQTVDSSAETIENYLTLNEQQCLALDHLVCATGDETLERRINRLVWAHIDSSHVWVEPIGLGGHVLSTVPGTAGCFECLFRVDEEDGPLNMSGLAAPNQRFQRTMAGCAGTFTPFSALDAEQMALLASRQVAARVLADKRSPELVTWASDGASFTDAGFRLSMRGSRLRGSGVCAEHDFARPDCPVCGRRA
ncbi:MAG: ThiF family adenylyltransferase [Phycisphaerales bacterium]|nr:ThiF family adenylyltransferase [Phycisphaerales bacterium]